jgi:hypothetical protein
MQEAMGLIPYTTHIHKIVRKYDFDNDGFFWYTFMYSGIQVWVQIELKMLIVIKYLPFLFMLQK